jgi:hypothetical protein
MKRSQTKAWLLWVAVSLGTTGARADDPFSKSADKTELAADGDDNAVDGRSLAPNELKALLARHANEPSVDEVVLASLKAARHDPARFADMAHRAKLRGLVPNLDLGARRGQGVDLRETASGEPLLTSTTADDLTLFATLRFDLGRLIYANEEVSIERESRFEQQAQNELIRQVVHVYFLRRRLLLERDLQVVSDIRRELRIEEAEALLDAFTDGAFRRMLKRSRSPWTTGASTNAPGPR